MRLPERDEINVTALYVEDDETTREILAAMIGTQFPGLELHAAADGKTGVEAFMRCKADIVITDIAMPHVNGLEMTRLIKAICPNVKIIVLTAFDNIEYLVECIELGVHHYVTKPIDNQVLFTAIEKCIDAIFTERLFNEQQEHIRKLSRAVEKSPAMVMITDVHGAIEYVNPKFCEVTGYALADLRGQNPRLLKSELTPAEVYADLWQTVLAGREWHGEFANRKKDGELYWEQVSISPLPNDDGVITHFVAVREDITKRRLAEQEIAALNASLNARATELEAANQELEAFNYSVSHDLRAPLTVINGCCQLIMEVAGDRLDETCHEFLSEILGRVEMMNELIRALLNFSRINRCDMNFDTIDLSQIAMTVVSQLRLADATGRTIEWKITPGIHVVGDYQLLRVVLDNLLGNAWKYTGKNETVLIEFGVQELAGKKVYYVRDNGAGFDATQSDKLFNPFQRLHRSEEFSGTGIGLATVKRIIQRHGGSVWAVGEVGKGATFFFTLES
jgi:PAS domain S-box-containing protein